MEFIKNEKLFKSFNDALKKNVLIFITAATGFGKTRFIEEALKDYQYDYYSLKDSVAILMPSKSIVVIDDFQYIVNKDYLFDTIFELCKTVKHLIICSRTNPNQFFMEAVTKRGVLEIGEEDLSFTIENYKVLLKDYLTEDEIVEVYRASFGMAMNLVYFKNRLESGEKYSIDFFNSCREVYFNHLKTAVFDFMDSEVLHFLIQVSVVDSFTIDLARAITMNDKAKMLATKAMHYGSFLFLENEVYRLRPTMLMALRMKSFLYYSDQEYKEFMFNAGHYYESIGDIEKALKIYEKCNGIQAIKRILVHNSSVNPAIGHFKILKKYYEMLDKKDIENNPALIGGMCMLYALVMDVDKSEYYYGKLVELKDSITGVVQEEISDALRYLDIALPQRRIEDLVTLLDIKNKNTNWNSTPIFALTANCLSIMNGGKDFTPFMKNFETVLATYGSLFSTSMGNVQGKGLISTIATECMYETGADRLQVLQLIAKSRMEVDKLEIDNLTVLSRLEASLLVEMGKAGDAILIYQSLIQDPSVKNPQMLKNIKAQIVWMNIILDNRAEVEKWIALAPNEKQDFFTLDRVEYLMKIRAYIYLEKYDEAYGLIQKMKYYAEQYHRYYAYAECVLLECIIRYHTELDYLSLLFEALKIAEESHLYRIIVCFGITIDEMIQKNRSKLVEMGISMKFLLELNPLLLNMATRYPKLFNKEDNIIPKLSQTGLMILQLQSQGHSLKDIGDRLMINLETVRYHAKQNYKKLGASGSTEAVIIAKKYGIL